MVLHHEPLPLVQSDHVSIDHDMARSELGVGEQGSLASPLDKRSVLGFRNDSKVF